MAESAQTTEGASQMASLEVGRKPTQDSHQDSTDRQPRNATER
jgi:hypothetical protein